MVQKKKLKKEIGTSSKKKLRPVVVAVLGHVNHGKTSILDYIRKTKVAEKEAGGITQSIGAYQAAVDSQKITFIDTPGHEAFIKMRARGGQVADLVVLVIAADDGVMPQTQESLEIIKKAKLPFLVAVNKIDLPSANIQRVYEQLEKEGVVVEARGGDVVTVCCSAKTGQGIDELLEMIILLGEMLELESKPEAPLEAVVIESVLGKAGPQASLIVKKGTLRIGDQIDAGGYQAKVRALMNEFGNRISEVGPSQPVAVLGFSQLPPVGVKVTQAKTVSREGKTPEKKTTQPLKIDEEKFKIVIKADSVGSLEALLDSLPEEVLVVKSEVGEITKSDIMMAQTSQAEIFSFRVKPSSQIKKLAEEEGVKLRNYQIIYKLLKDLEETILKAGEKEEEEKILGKAEIVSEFPYGEKGRIAGCRVIMGRIGKADRVVNLEREGKVLGRVKISSMKRLDEDISVAREGSEFGAILEGLVDFEVGDMLVSLAR